MSEESSMNKRILEELAQSLDETMQPAGRMVFVIMPFRRSPSRNETQLTAFYRRTLKQTIESASGLKHRYSVKRSESSFDITEQIILDIYRADIVIADLSGISANPNVMYELGVRLATSHKPTLLIRERNAENERIFDIQGFYVHPYDPLDCEDLEQHLIEKIARLEVGSEDFASPVLKILSSHHRSPSQVVRESVAGFIDSLNWGMRSHMSSVLGALFHHCREAGIEIGTPDPAGILSAITEGGGAEKIDWTRLGYIPNCHPAVEKYLVARPLRGLVATGVEREFDSAVTEWYSRYFSTTFFWTQICSFPEVVNYIISIGAIGRRANMVAEILRSDPSSDDHSELLKEYLILASEEAKRHASHFDFAASTYGVSGVELRAQADKEFEGEPGLD